MAKPFSASDKDIKHWMMPEVTGNIVGLGGEARQLQTVEDIQALQKQGFDEGREEGHKEGYAAGLKKGQDEMQARIQQLNQLLNSIAKPLLQFDAVLEKELAQLSLHIARMLLKKECSVDAEHISRLIHESLAFLPASARNVRIKLNPQDIEFLEQSGQSLKTEEWTCVADKTVTQGGCVIDSDTSHIDASVEDRIQQLFDQLMNSHQPARNGDA
jgi:flagellar assembly protein FliH